jgi:transcriptional regulator with XRE-family HTH domain
MDKIDLALAEEVRREIAGRNLSAKTVYEALGISQSAYYNYFTAATRPIKLRVLFDLADFFGMAPEELIARARARAESASPLEDLLTPQARDAVEQGRAEVRRKAAEGDAEDPPDSTRGRRRSA